ncbi:MAG: endo-1,4-beta-xylanase [Myxococcota bacterium]|nr:endo-1,4-beta-xylanase [Myxococcota bacterium]
MRALPTDPCLEPGSDCTLRELADLAGVRIGAATQPALIQGDPTYAEILPREFGSLTPENQMKWVALRPDRDTYRFGPADELVAFAEANGMRVRGHTLLWSDPIRIPDWVSAIDDPVELQGVLDEHIDTVGRRYAGRVDAWDVVNEPLEIFGPPVLRDNVYLDLLGPDYIAQAFHAARAADPGAVLFLNETQVTSRAKFDALYALVTDLLAQGVPIDAVGLQGHYLTGFNEPAPGFLQEMVQAFADLGLLVELTELDMPVTPLTPDRLEAQARSLGRVMSECLAVEACQGITFWGFTDRYTWIDSFLAPGLIPLPFDVDYQKKPAWFAAADALRARAVGEPALLGLAAILGLGCARRRA